MASGRAWRVSQFFFVVVCVLVTCVCVCFSLSVSVVVRFVTLRCPRPLSPATACRSKW